MRDLTKVTKVEYDSVRPNLDTFDLVLWSGNGRLSRFIQYGTRSTWSHVGLVVKMPGDILMLWESTIHSSEGNVVDGVQFTPLSLSIMGDMAVRRMTANRTPDMFDKLMAVRAELDGRPFERSWMEFFLAGYDGPFGHNTRDLTTLFCAELVAETLQQVGLLDPAKSSNEFTPRDFSEETRAPLALLQGATLGEETFLKRSASKIKAQAAKEVLVNSRGMCPEMI